MRHAKVLAAHANDAAHGLYPEGPCAAHRMAPAPLSLPRGTKRVASSVDDSDAGSSKRQSLNSGAGAGQRALGHSASAAGIHTDIDDRDQIQLDDDDEIAVAHLGAGYNAQRRTSAHAAASAELTAARAARAATASPPSRAAYDTAYTAYHADLVTVGAATDDDDVHDAFNGYRAALGLTTFPIVKTEPTPD